jgi:hypothetical protein
MRHSLIAACLVALVLSSAADARPHAARITPETAAKLRELRAKTAPLKAAIREDLQAIKSGGYVSREDIRGLGDAVVAAVSDRELTDSEKEALKNQARAVGEQVPAELRAKLRSDVEALIAVLEAAR